MKGLTRITLFFVFIGATLGCEGQVRNTHPIDNQTKTLSIEEKQNAIPDTMYNGGYRSLASIDFTFAAHKVTAGVVHINSSWKVEEDRNDIEDMESVRKFFGDHVLRHFFEPYHKKGPLQASASGVIVTDDGYIITNNHVVEGAEEIEVVLYDQRTYKARIIGNDPKTDLALIKIKETDLTFIPFGSSDNIAVGEWVLAVGNPFNLSSTVTAGIISAKSRNINIMTDSEATESFIQTDAAVNPGNSGGALVDLNGKLIGINTAIATPTGAFAGYSFAIPVVIVKKVAEDLLRYGSVQRASLGIIITDMTGNLAKNLHIKFFQGVFVDSLIQAGAAMEAGIKKGDVIFKIDNADITTTAQLQEIMATHRPGEKLNLTIIRNNKRKQIIVTLKAPIVKAGETDVHADILELLGIDIEPITEEEKRKFKLRYGLRVIKIESGKINEFTNMQPGFIITRVNGVPVNTKEGFIATLTSGNHAFMIAGIYPGVEGEVFYGFVF